jgi:hypothetical protein
MRLRNRIIKATFYTDPELCRWPRDKREFYRSLWACAEDSCCLEDDMFGVKLAAWPSPLDADMTVERFEEWRDEMIADGKLVRYESQGQPYLYLPTMAEHERPRNPQAPDVPLPEWVEWTPHGSDQRKGLYNHSTTLVQGLYNASTTLPVLSCPVLSCPDRSGVQPRYDDMPKCLSQTEHKGRPLSACLVDALGETFGPSWVMKQTNLGKLGSSIKEGCPADCDGSCAAECAGAFDEIATKHADKVGLVFYAIANDPRPWAEVPR